MIVLFLLPIIVFWEDCQKNDRIWMERRDQPYEDYLREEEEQHIEAYHETVQATVDQADKMSGISIFAEENSFSSRNRTLTKKAFEPLLDVNLTYVKGRTITEFFSFRFGSFCALACGILVAFELGEIRKKKVRAITFPTEYGRLRLAFEKVGALFIWALIITFLFQVSTLVEGILLFHENPLRILSCPAQTFACFASFSLKTTVWQAMFLYLLYRTIILYVIMTLAWAVSVVLDHVVLAAGVCGGVFAVEYFLYAKIDDNNVWKLLKFCNVWYQTAENSYFTKYKNLNILGYAVNRNTAILTALAIAFLSGAAAGIVVCCRRYPCSSKVSRLQKMISVVRVKFEAFRGRFLERLSLTGMESYKALIVQRGLVAIILLGVLLYYRADFTQVRRTTQQELYYAFMEQYLGKPGEESRREIERVAEELEQVDQSYIQKITEEDLSLGDQIVLGMWYESFEEDRKFLKQIQEQTESLENISEERGIAVWYVNLYGYDHLLKSDDVMLNLGLFLAILWICLGIYNGENGSGMICMINSSHRQKFLYRTKICVGMILTSVVYLMVLLFQIISVAVVYGIAGIRAPVQSILALSDVRVHCTIWQYFLARYVLKCGIYLVVCICVCKVMEIVICKKGLHNGIKNRKSV